jgi:hypothetical protein
MDVAPLERPGKNCGSAASLLDIYKSESQSSVHREVSKAGFPDNDLAENIE